MPRLCNRTNSLLSFQLFRVDPALHYEGLRRVVSPGVV